VTWETVQVTRDMGNGTGITWHGKQDKNHVTWETGQVSRDMGNGTGNT